MFRKPDYTTARNPKEFSWSVSGSYLSCIALSGVPFRDFFLRPDACIEAYRVGRQKQKELFDPAEVSLPSPATPPVSYGHANGRGARLFFPEGGEVAVEHCFAHSLEEAMEALIAGVAETLELDLVPGELTEQERAWMAESRPIRDLYQGVLQVGLAFLQIEQGNWAGALKMFRRGLPRLA